MALAPYVFGDLYDTLMCPLGFGSIYSFNRNFGLNVNPRYRHNLLSSPLGDYMCSLRNSSPQNSGLSSLELGEDGFKVNLDVQQFKPDEINVKVMGDSVVVEGKHEERQDAHGYISRHFQRRYKIPGDIDMNALVSKLSSDGVLSIEAPKKAAIPSSKERIIQINRTNAPAVSSRPQGQDSKKITLQDTKNVDVKTPKPSEEATGPSAA